MRRSILALVPFLILTTAPAFTETASLVRDLNPATGTGTGIYPTQLRAVGGKVFFTVEGPAGEVWVSDGTPAGTLLLWTCENFCRPRLRGSVGDTILWVVQEEGEELPRLWRSDGTRPGTFPLLGPEQETQLIVTETPSPNWAVFRGRLWFSACHDGRCSLWQTDGTPEGTVQDTDVPAPGPEEMIVAGSHLYFRTGTFFDQELWATDGTPGNARKVAELSDTYPETVAAGDRLFFVAPADGFEVWASDGTPSGTRPVSRFTANGAVSGPLQAVGNRVYFLANEPPDGLEVWVSDGTPLGTRRVTGFRTEQPTSTLEEVGGRLVILVQEATRFHLWTTDGRPESTAPLPPPEPCSDCHGVLSSQTKLVRAGSRIVFAGQTPEHGVELWSTDGRQGPRLVKDFCPGPCYGFGQLAFPWPGGVLFSARSDSSSGADLWFSDGTAQGTRRLTAVPSPGSAALMDPVGAVALGSTLVFAAWGPPGTGLWASEGPASTRLVMALGNPAASSNPRDLTALGDRLFFTMCPSEGPSLWSTRGTPDSTVAAGGSGDPLCGILGAGPGFVLAHNLDPFNPELWRTDGTVAGTYRLVEGFRPSQLASAAVLDGRVFFPDQLGSSASLWVSDGTVAGTEPLLSGLVAPLRDLATVSDRLYFTAGNPSGDSEVWISDGTASGSRPLVAFDFSFTAPARFTRFGSLVYFPSPDSRLWHTDGTPGGTLPVGEPGQFGYDLRELTAFQGALFYLSTPLGTSDVVLWRTDGTAEGTLALHTFEELPPSGESQRTSELTVIGGRLVFAARDEAGLELWTSDGTAAGTRRLRDIAPGPDSSSPSGLTVAAGRVFFAARTRAHGIELWQTDGTEAGTRLVQDLWPLSASSRPELLTVAGDRLYFTADDGLHGRELWSLPSTAAQGCHPSSTRLCLNGGRFQVEAVWRDFQDRDGVGHAVPLTSDTGYFWFFDPANVETVIKVLDGRGVNDHFWVFYGALSNVGYSLTVTDTQTGAARRYTNPQGQFASVGDTKGFGPLGAFSITDEPAAGASLVLAERRIAPASAAVPCVASATRLCLNGDRFAVEAFWKDFQGHEGAGTAVELTSDTGYFWFFDAANVEVVLKVLDGTALNGHYWVFYGALSNVEYTLRVTDTVTGEIETYRNPSGRFGSVGDTTAF